MTQQHQESRVEAPTPLSETTPSQEQKGIVANPQAWQDAQSSVSGATHISSFEELKQKAPKLYKTMMDSFAMEICRQSRRANARIREIYLEQRRKS
jgi:hypothetical protein